MARREAFSVFFGLGVVRQSYGPKAWMEGEVGRVSRLRPLLVGCINGRSDSCVDSSSDLMDVDIGVDVNVALLESQVVAVVALGHLGRRRR